MKGNINEAVSKFILGENLYSEEKLKEAIGAFESVLKIEDNHSLSHYFLYMIHNKIGNPKKATFHFKISIASPGQMGTTNLDKLIDVYKQKHNKPKKKATDSNVLFDQGNKYYREREFEKAIKTYKEAIEVNPDDKEIYFNLGLVYFKVNRLNESIVAYKNAIKIKPDDEHIHNNLGMAYMKLERFDEAIISFQEAIRLRSDYGDAHYDLGLVYAQKGNTNEAIVSFEEAIKSNPNDKGAYFNLGLAYRKLELLDKAISAYKKAITLNPNYELAYFFLGAAYGANGQLDEARKAYKNSLRLKENNKFTHFNLGLNYKAGGRPDEAKYHFKRALELGYEAAKNQLDNLEAQSIINPVINRKFHQASIIRTLSGHTDPVNACAISPDGSFVVSAAGDTMKIYGHQSDNTLKIWDFETGAERFTLSGHNEAVKACSVSKDSSSIISVSEDCLVVWNAQTGEKVNRFKSLGGFACSECTDESAIVIVSFFIALLDIKSGKERISMLTDDMLHDCAISNDGTFIVTAGTDLHLVVWNAKDGEKMARLQYPNDINPTGDIKTCTISPDNTFIVSGSNDGTLRIWDAESFKEKRFISAHEDEITCCDVSSNNSRIVSSSYDGTMKIWEVATGKNNSILEGHSGIVNGCTFSPCGKYVISVGEDKTVKIWEING